MFMQARDLNHQKIGAMTSPYKHKCLQDTSSPHFLDMGSNPFLANLTLKSQSRLDAVNDGHDGICIQKGAFEQLT